MITKLAAAKKMLSVLPCKIVPTFPDDRTLAGKPDGKPVDLATIKSLASIPALPVLQAQVLGTMLAPISGLACVLKQIAERYSW